MTSRPRTLKQKFDEKVERGLDRLEASTVAPVGKYFNHQKDRFKEAASLEAKKIGLDAPGLSDTSTQGQMPYSGSQYGQGTQQGPYGSQQQQSTNDPYNSSVPPSQQQPMYGYGYSSTPGAASVYGGSANPPPPGWTQEQWNQSQWDQSQSQQQQSTQYSGQQQGYSYPGQESHPQYGYNSSGAPEQQQHPWRPYRGGQ